MSDFIIQGNGSGAGTFTLQSPNIAGNLTLTAPAADGTNGQALVTNGSGTLSFASVSTSPGGSTTQVQYNNAGSFGGITNATTDGTTLSMTSPKIITAINDTNANELIKFTATGSAVNEITVANAATGNAPTISATGGDTDVGITLTPKGAGRTTVTQLTTTSPRVLTAINDTNGNELIGLTATGSAVNEITVANAATGNNPVISATGGDTNIGITLTPKGTGAIKLSGLSYPTADGTANQVIQTNGSGVLSFATVSGSPGGSDTYVQFNDSGSFGGDAGLTYNKTTDALTAAGTVTAAKLVPTGNVTAGNGMYLPTTNALAFGTNGTEAMRINSSQNVGIGTSSPGAKLDVSGGDIRAIGGTNSLIGTYGASSSSPQFVLGNASGTAHWAIYETVGAAGQQGSLNIFDVVASQSRVIIDLNGNLLVGYTSSSGSYKLQVNSQIFATSATIATSDSRYKENVTPLTNCLDVINALNPVQFSWKQHPVHNFDRSTPTVGFIAQEVQQVLADKPYLNSIIKANECEIEPAEYETIIVEPAVDEVLDDEGNVIVEAKAAVTERGALIKEAVKEDFYGIAEGNMIAILTKAIQELKAIVDAQAARIAALETKEQ